MALRLLWRRTTRIDRILILVLLAVCVFSFTRVLGRPAGNQDVIYRGDEVAYTGPLGLERTLELSGPLGATRVEIFGGEVRVLESPCPRKICIALGKVHRSGDLLACVPNHIVVRIEGEEERGYDLLSR